MSTSQMISQLLACGGELAVRVTQAQQYQQDLARGAITGDEYQDLMSDLERLDSIQLSAQGLELKVQFYEIMQALKNIPIP